MFQIFSVSLLDMKRSVQILEFQPVAIHES